MGRPLVTGSDGDRGDARVLQRLDVGEELVPRGRWRVDPGLGEEVLVVPEAHHAGVERHAVLLAVDLVELHGTGVEVTDEARGLVGDVPDQSGFDLIAEATAAPGLEEVGHVAGLQVRLDRGLERLVLHHGDVDLHVRVLGHVGVGHRLPVGLAGSLFWMCHQLISTASPDGASEPAGASDAAGASVAAPPPESSSLPQAATTSPSAAARAMAQRRRDDCAVSMVLPLVMCGSCGPGRPARAGVGNDFDLGDGGAPAWTAHRHRAGGALERRTMSSSAAAGAPVRSVRSGSTVR